MNEITTITSDIYSAKDGFVSVLVDQSINFEREAGFAVQAISASDYALKIAMSNRQSVVNAVTNIAAIGISLNPAKKQAYLVPRDRKICLDISYMGLMDLAMNTGSIKWAQAALVCAQDTFALNGFDKPPTHGFNPFSKDRGEIVGVYVVVKTADGEYLTHTMEIGDVYSIRDRSTAWVKGEVGKKGPWESDSGEMIKKTCVKQAYKYWPKTERLEKAIHHLNVDGGEGLAAIAPAYDPSLANEWIARANEQTDAAELAKVWADGVKVFNGAKDVEGKNKFKEVVASKGAALKAIPKDVVDAEFVAAMGE